MPSELPVTVKLELQEERTLHPCDDANMVDFNATSNETVPESSFHTCTDEVDSEEFVNEEKLYCSEECIEKETEADLNVESHKRRVSLPFLHLVAGVSSRFSSIATSAVYIKILVQQMANGVADYLAKHLSRFHLFK